ncbi:MAG: HD-GYP domain-containing protein [Proteobacteria bacterium]|nr:HD-GYP domain-containing protein [Pseudomonadota bacterium]
MENLSEPPQNLLEVATGSLQPGMYIAGLDRPWLDTPFAVQGFFVRDSEDISFVAKHCSYVYVDPRRYRKLAVGKDKSPSRAQASPNSVSLKLEFIVATVELESASEAMSKVFTQLRNNGHLDVRAMQRIVNPLIDSVLRNSEAMAALVRIKSQDDYLFNHSLSNAVWAAVFGRHLGLDRLTLKRLVLGAAIVDVGMTQLDASLLNHERTLTEVELDCVKKHVGVGVELLKESGNVHEDVVAIVECHHERFDGSGYPQGLEGQTIPLLARLTGLVDSYDAMITTRPHAQARSSFEALQELSDLKDQLFQGALVEQFLQAIGLFPTGSVVEFNTGEVGVVVHQNPSRRLKPKIVVILDQAKKPYTKMVIVDLAKYDLASANAPELWISRELGPCAYGIQPDEYFL